MNYKQIVAIAALLLGIGLIIYSVQTMDTFREFVSVKIKGEYSAGTMWSLIGGILLVILGASCTVIFRTIGKK